MTEGQEEESFLVRMHSFLQWKVLAPDVSNPFERKFSDKALQELANDKEVLMKYLELKGLMDGDEVFHLVGIKAIKEVKTDNPYIRSMTKAEIKQYLQDYGIMEVVNQQMDDIQRTYQEELQRRAAENK